MEAVLQAVANPCRREILRLVWDAERSAGEIAGHFAMSWPAVSQNLRILREAGLVAERRRGNHRLYRADQQALGPLAAVLHAMWEQDLARLQALAEEEDRQANGR
jgi:DNA-binding transcriptional ArsR family regulator